jgi:hypothetical protein
MPESGRLLLSLVRTLLPDPVRLSGSSWKFVPINSILLGNRRTKFTTHVSVRKYEICAWSQYRCSSSPSNPVTVWSSFVFEEFRLSKQTTTFFVFVTSPSTPRSSLRSVTCSLHRVWERLSDPPDNWMDRSNTTPPEVVKIFTSTYDNFIQKTVIPNSPSHYTKNLSFFNDNLDTSDINHSELIIKIDISSVFNVTCQWFFQELDPKFWYS